jgi:hypothetical protein
MSWSRVCGFANGSVKRLARLETEVTNSANASKISGIDLQSMEGVVVKCNGKTKARRPIEREYLATLNAAVPLDTWQAICQRAADDALAGDAKARDWLAKWLLGLESRLLTTLAAEELVAVPADAAEFEISARRQKIEDDGRADEQNRLLVRSLFP